jgi:acetyl-CoA acyltransferase
VAFAVLSWQRTRGEEPDATKLGGVGVITPRTLAWAYDTGGDLAKTNVNGGAIAIGHPLGASGARIMTTLVNALEERGGRYGLQTMCEGGGMANATIIERLG